MSKQLPSASGRQVAIVQRVLPHYRVAFFEKLHARLGSNDVDLRVIYGQPHPQHANQSVDVHATWAHRITNTYLSCLGRHLVWQPCLDLVHRADLVVVEESSRLLVNYLLSMRRPCSGSKLAYWGHGRNMQREAGFSLSEFLKRGSLDFDWYFAYTEMSARYVAERGYPRSRITTVDNTIDCTELRHALEACSVQNVIDVKQRLRIEGDRIGLYCGSMYGDKQLPFLLEACARIKHILPDFLAVFVGDGPSRDAVIAACRKHDWIRYVGPKYGRDLAPFYHMSKALLIPAAVGLVMVDSFVARIPLFTTAAAGHGPEIAYLENGVNGIVTEKSVEQYADAVAHHLGDAAALTRLQFGCQTSSHRYTLENMVNRFAEGISRCLALT
jgi:L-malate glycosyltransferase